MEITREYMRFKLEGLLSSAFNDEEDMLDFIFDEGEYALGEQDE